MKTTTSYFAGLVMALMLVINVSSVFAQPGMRSGAALTPEKIAERQTTHMTDALVLTDEQAAKVKEANLAFAKKRVEKRKAADEQREKMRAEMKALGDEHLASLKPILSDEQYAKMEKMHNSKRQGGKKNMRQGKRGKRGGKHGMRGNQGRKACDCPCQK